MMARSAALREEIRFLTTQGAPFPAKSSDKEPRLRNAVHSFRWVAKKPAPPVGYDFDRPAGTAGEVRDQPEVLGLEYPDGYNDDCNGEYPVKSHYRLPG
jgi:hypothetical protein